MSVTVTVKKKKKKKTTGGPRVETKIASERAGRARSLNDDVVNEPY